MPRCPGRDAAHDGGAGGGGILLINSDDERKEQKFQLTFVFLRDEMPSDARRSAGMRRKCSKLRW